MREAISYGVLALLIFGAGAAPGQSNHPKSHASQPAERVGKPELVVILSVPMSDKIAVKNIGKGSAGPSKLTLDCVRVGAPTQMNSCPDLPPSAMVAYFDAAFPNNATIQVPALAAGATFTHILSFWNDFRWTNGKYKFTAVADASHTIHEVNSKNNVAISTLTVP
jgi:CARDB